MILTVTLNPAVDHTVFVEGLRPFDTNRVVRTETDAGGKGVNLSRMVAELGGRTVATGFLGGQTGAFVRAVLDRQGVQHDFVEIDAETRTNVSVEDGSGRPPTAFSDPGPPIDGLAWETLLSRVAAWLPRCGWLAVGGSLPPGLPDFAYRVLGEMARSNGVPWVLDADGIPFVEGLQAGPSLVKPNANEAARFLGAPVTTTGHALAAARALRERQSAGGAPDPVAIVSLGAEGAVAVGADGEFVASPIPVEARSTIGSGDSLIGGFLCGLERGLPLPEALRLGTAAGAATATTDGTRMGNRTLVEELQAKAHVRPFSAE